MIRLVAVLAAGSSAVWWVLAGPWQVKARRELEAVRSNSAVLQLWSWIASVAVAGMCAGVGFVLGHIGVGLAIGVVPLSWGPHLLPRLLEEAAVTSYRRQRDRVALGFFRRVRLLVAAGRTIEVAVQTAAQDETHPAFGPISAAVHDSVSSTQNPLIAIGLHLSGGPADTLLATAEAAAKSGGASAVHLEQVLRRTVQALEDERRVAVERLGRATASNASTAGMLVMVPMLASIMATLQL